MRMVISVPEPWGSNRVRRDVRRWVGQIHSLDVDDPAIRVKLHEFASVIEAAFFRMDPLITELAAGLRFIDTDGHGQAFGAEKPSKIGNADRLV